MMSRRRKSAEGKLRGESSLSFVACRQDKVGRLTEEQIMMKVKALRRACLSGGEWRLLKKASAALDELFVKHNREAKPEAKEKEKENKKANWGRFLQVYRCAGFRSSRRPEQSG